MTNPESQETAILESWRRFTNQRFLEWQQLFGERKTVTEFAEYLGFAQSTVSLWMNGSRFPKKLEEIKKLSHFWGLGVYDALKIERPDEYLYNIESVWGDLPAEKRRSLSEDVMEYAKKKKKK